MTNPNDTQDEEELSIEEEMSQSQAEKYCFKIYGDPVERKNFSHSIATKIDYSNGYLDGYRAGVATVADKRLELAAKYSDLAAKYCASLAEVEQLKFHRGSREVRLQSELAAEKQKAQKLVDALDKITGQGTMNQMFIIADEAIRDYSTDSGDGVG